jgi:hypothetical protein
MANPNPKTAQLKPFVKGDPRINRKGVPPDAIAGRKFIAQVGAELIKTPASDGKPSEEMSRFYAMVRRMYSSSQPRDRELILKATLPGLLKDEVDINNPDGYLYNESVIYDRVMAKIQEQMAGNAAAKTKRISKKPVRR